MRIPPSILKQHNKRDDAWTAIYGKVYNITAYLPFHPGGVKALMRAAGRDGTKLFGLYIFYPPFSPSLRKKSVSCLYSNYPRLGECRFYA